MRSKRLTGYTGYLTPDQIADGINKANENAKRLAEDARLLFDAERYPSAASLAILAIEESGKVSVLRSLALARNEEEIKQTWKEFRKHTAKNAGWIFAELVAGGARQLENFRAMYLEEAEHPFVLDKLKQVGFYTDCYGKGRWSAPKDALDKESTSGLVLIAEIQSRHKFVTATEIEL